MICAAKVWTVEASRSLTCHQHVTLLTTAFSLWPSQTHIFLIAPSTCLPAPLSPERTHPPPCGCYARRVLEAQLESFSLFGSDSLPSRPRPFPWPHLTRRSQQLSVLVTRRWAVCSNEPTPHSNNLKRKTNFFPSHVRSLLWVWQSLLSGDSGIRADSNLRLRPVNTWPPPRRGGSRRRTRQHGTPSPPAVLPPTVLGLGRALLSSWGQGLHLALPPSHVWPSSLEAQPPRPAGPSFTAYLGGDSPSPRPQ